MRVYHFSQEIKMINKNLGTVDIALDEYERVFILKVHQKDSNQFGKGTKSCLSRLKRSVSNFLNTLEHAHLTRASLSRQ